MKTILSSFVAVLLLCLTLPAQVSQLTAPDCQFGFMYSVVGGVVTGTPPNLGSRLPASQDVISLVGYDNRNTNCTSWTMMYQTDGIATVSLELDEATSNGDIAGSWVLWPTPASGTVLPFTLLNVGAGSMFGYFPWVSVNVNSATGTGRIYGRVLGWKPQAQADVTAPGNSVVLAGFSYKHINTAANTLIKGVPGTLHTITVNGGTSGIVTVVDTSVAACTGGTGIATTVAVGTTPVTLTYDIGTINGLCITTAAATDLTISFR